MTSSSSQITNNTFGVIENKNDIHKAKGILTDLTELLNSTTIIFYIIIVIVMILIVFSAYLNHQKYEEIYDITNKTNETMTKYLDVITKSLDKTDEKYYQLKRFMFLLYEEINEINETLISITDRINSMDYDIYQIILLLNDKINQLDNNMQCNIFKMLQ